MRYYDDSVRNCTFGIGTLVHLGPCTQEELQRQVAPAAVEAEFVRRVHEAELAVRRNVPDRNLTQAQFDALVSFTYNLGATGARSVLHTANRGEDTRVANQMEQYVYAHPRDDRGRRLPPRRQPGLVTRRREESAPFRNQQGGQ
ncbi:lysozyme [Trinickia sp. LjRoot230]|uniref:lysozyme n=1 Tax=Trinickia sp. LjRoot230 TaxID=3342288 RepID=UPI003F50A5DE